MIVISAAHAFFRVRPGCPVVGQRKCAVDKAIQVGHFLQNLVDTDMCINDVVDHSNASEGLL